MKIDFRFGKTKQSENFEETHNYEVDFSIVGTTFIPQEDIVKAVRPSGSMELVRQRVLAELMSLLQVELYGKVLSNESKTYPKKLTEY